MVPYLTAKYPMQSDAWQDWQAAPRNSFEGRWRVVGSMPGRGDFSGVMTTTAKEGDQYSVELDGLFTDGQGLSGTGTAVVYTGYEWRATLDLEQRPHRPVIARVIEVVRDAGGGEPRGSQPPHEDVVERPPCRRLSQVPGHPAIPGLLERLVETAAVEVSENHDRVRRPLGVLEDRLHLLAAVPTAEVDRRFDVHRVGPDTAVSHAHRGHRRGALEAGEAALVREDQLARVLDGPR